MNKRVVIFTGAPGSGKTTLIRRVVERLGVPAGGFYTQEVREQGVRKGFAIYTLDGQRGTLARVGIRSQWQVGKYGVNLRDLEELAVPAVYEALNKGWLVVIDEIGPMEILSTAFQEVVLEALESGSDVLATVVRRSTPFTDRIKSRPEVLLLDVRPSNREQLLERIVALFLKG